MAKTKYRVYVNGYVDVSFDPESKRPEGIMPDDEWRSQMYGHIKTPEDLARHLAYNAAFNGIENLSMLDGFADLPDSMAEIGWPRSDVVDEWEVEEIEPPSSEELP